MCFRPDFCKSTNEKCSCCENIFARFFFWDKGAFMHLTIFVSQHSQAWKFSWHVGLRKSDGENDVVKWSLVSKYDARKQLFLENGSVSKCLAWNFFIYLFTIFFNSKRKTVQMQWKKNCFQNKNLKIIFLLWELFICMCTKVWSSLGQSSPSPQLRNIHVEIALARYCIWRTALFLQLNKNQ